MKKIIAGILIGLAALPMFATPEFGDIITAEQYYEDSIEFETRMYLSEKYPEMSEEEIYDILSKLVENHVNVDPGLYANIEYFINEE